MVETIDQQEPVLPEVVDQADPTEETVSGEPGTAEPDLSSPDEPEKPEADAINLADGSSSEEVKTSFAQIALVGSVGDVSLPVPVEEVSEPTPADPQVGVKVRFKSLDDNTRRKLVNTFSNREVTHDPDSGSWYIEFFGTDAQAILSIAPGAVLI